MAHFAKLDENNIVLEVHVVSNDVLDPENEEASGIAFLTEWSGGHKNWKQTSYNGTIRKNYASVKGVYNADFNAFIAPKPYDSWKLNYETFLWEAPLPMPEETDEYSWKWAETNKEWIKFQLTNNEG